MKTHVIAIGIILLAVSVFTSCEAPYVGPAIEEPETSDANVIIHTSIYQQVPFNMPVTRATQDISELCTRIGFAIFKNGEKLKAVNQTPTTAGFGTAAFELSEGEYKIVIIAHNCDGTATISSEDKITFPNNVVSDTFYYYGTFTVGDGTTELDLELQRAVAMVRISITDPMPDDIRQMKFYYTGGSSTFSAATGYGCVNSKQTVKIDVTPDMVGKPTTWEIYTLPHADDGKLDLTISAMDASGNAVYERQLAAVPVTVGLITTYSGTLFSADPSTVEGKQFHLTANGEWGEGYNGKF